MRARTYNDITVNGIRSGFTLRDSVILRKETDYKPHIQTFTFEDFEEGEPEERTYWCSECKGRLTYLENTETIWRCDNCLSYYDTKIQDRPIRDKSDFKLRAHHNPYQQYSENDPNIVFVKGIDPNKEEEVDPHIEIVRQSTDMRVQHIHVKGSLAKALAVMNKMDGRT